MPPSRPRSSTAPRRCRSSSTCGRRGAVRAARSGRSSRRSSTRPTARSCWSRSTSTRTRGSPRPSGCRASRWSSRLKDGQPVDGFLGAHPEHAVREFVERLLPTEEEQTVAGLLEAGDEVSLRQALELDPGQRGRPSSALAELLVDAGRARGGARRCWPASPRPPRCVASPPWPAWATMRPRSDDYDAKLTALLDRVKDDEDARQEFVDLLELMGPDDPRTAPVPPPAHQPAVLTALLTARLSRRCGPSRPIARRAGRARGSCPSRSSAAVRELDRLGALVAGEPAPAEGHELLLGGSRQGGRRRWRGPARPTARRARR